MAERIKGFDGLRGLSVIAVILTHLGLWTTLENDHGLPHSITTLVHAGAGVQAFFILSGFLITLLLLDEYEQYGKISVKNFIIRRTLRIFPLYILFLIIATALHIFGHNVTSWHSLYYAYLYSYNFVPKSIYTAFMGHTWSLAVEEHYYLIWPVIFYFVYPKYKKTLLALLVIFIGQALISHYLLLETPWAKQYFIARWSFIGGYPIAAGCIAALFCKMGRVPLLTTLASKPLFFAVGLLLYVNALYIPYNFKNTLHLVINNDIRGFGILLLLIWLFNNPHGRVANFLELQPLQYIGKISYGLYMYQGLFLSTGPTRIASQSWPPSQTIGLILLLTIAPLSYHYFEMPFLKLKHRFRQTELGRG